MRNINHLQLYTLFTVIKHETHAFLITAIILFFLWQKCICISLSQVSDDHFEMLLSYIDGLQGMARSSTLQKAEAIVRWEGQGEEADTADAEKRQQRAKQVVQML